MLVVLLPQLWVLAPSELLLTPLFDLALPVLSSKDNREMEWYLLTEAKTEADQP